MATLAGQEVWRQWIDQARNADFLEQARKHGAQLKKTGTAEWTGPCPLCSGKDRFSINVKKRVFNCRGCGGAGDVIAFVRMMTGGGFVESVELINGTPRPDRSRDETPDERKARLLENSKRNALYQQRKEEQLAAEDARAKRNEEVIDNIKKRAVEIWGTHGEDYIRGRGLNPHKLLMGDIKFVPDLDYWGVQDNGTRSVVHLATLPAIVAYIRDFSGAVIGLSQTYLDPVEPRKWTPIGSPTNSAKKIRGEKKGGLIRLGPASCETLALSEGWENALAWHQMGHGPEDVALAAAVDLGNLAGGATGPWPHPVLKDGDGRPARIKNGIPDPSHPGVILPPDIKSIILLADLDSETYATAAQLRTAGNRFRAMGLEVDIAWPPAVGQDWNDALISTGEGRHFERAPGP
jgi:hypothetical protein